VRRSAGSTAVVALDFGAGAHARGWTRARRGIGQRRGRLGRGSRGLRARVSRALGRPWRRSWSEASGEREKQGREERGRENRGERESREAAAAALAGSTRGLALRVWGMGP
jgi:hypothetical protein